MEENKNIVFSDKSVVGRIAVFIKDDLYPAIITPENYNKYLKKIKEHKGTLDGLMEFFAERRSDLKKEMQTKEKSLEKMSQKLEDKHLSVETSNEIKNIALEMGTIYDSENEAQDVYSLMLNLWNQKLEGYNELINAVTIMEVFFKRVDNSISYFNSINQDSRRKYENALLSSNAEVKETCLNIKDTFLFEIGKRDAAFEKLTSAFSHINISVSKALNEKKAGLDSFLERDRRLFDISDDEKKQIDYFERLKSDVLKKTDISDYEKKTQIDDIEEQKNATIKRGIISKSQVRQSMSIPSTHERYASGFVTGLNNDSENKVIDPDENFFRNRFGGTYDVLYFHIANNSDIDATTRKFAISKEHVVKSLTSAAEDKEYFSKFKEFVTKTKNGLQKNEDTNSNDAEDEDDTN